MAESKYKMSQARYDELVRELDHYNTVRTKEVAEQIKEARSYGDLSENSEYDEAKDEQGRVYSRIAELTDLIEHAEIVERPQGAADVISIGSFVRVRDLEYGDEDEYQIVGSQEANLAKKRFSDESPFGRGVIGHRPGETVTVDAPAGELQYEILSVRN